MKAKVNQKPVKVSKMVAKNMHKISSYNKLKLENAKLKQDIYNLVKRKGTTDGLTTEYLWLMKFDSIDSTMFGSRNSISLGLMGRIQLREKTRHSLKTSIDR